MFVLREAVRSIRRSPATFVMSVLALAVAVGLGGFLASAAYQASARMHEVRQNMKIEAFFDPVMTSAEAEQITTGTIRTLPLVQRAEFTSKEQALQEFARSSGENVEEILGMNPLPASARVYLSQPSATNAEHVTSALEAVRGVQSVKTDLPAVRTLESRTRLLETLALIFGGLCLLATLFFLVLAGRFTIAARRETEQVLSVLGASRSAIRRPVSIEALAVGLLGGLLAALLLVVIQRLALDKLSASIVMTSDVKSLALLAAACVVVAVVLSTLASAVARVTARS
jgi:cell division transport system permease protein